MKQRLKRDKTTITVVDQVTYDNKDECETTMRVNQRVKRDNGKIKGRKRNFTNN